MALGGYFIVGLVVSLLKLLVVILLMAINTYSIGGYCGYSINGYWWIFY